MRSVHAVILAGGSGTRFWPASRRLMPKQLLPLAGRTDEALIAATIRRIEPLIPIERVWVSTGAALVDATAAALPRVDRSRMLAEPVAATRHPASVGRRRPSRAPIRTPWWRSSRRTTS